jgi:AcrR family transcriptional regulator
VSYEVTKRIKGRDYRYRVESARHPETGRAATRWTYLGKVEDGELIAPARSVARRVTHDEIVAVTAKLLETRDASRVTVAVITHHAGVSPGTFYRHFPDRDAAFGAALTVLCERCFDDLPALDPPVVSPAYERRRLNAWFEALHQGVLRGRALRWFLTSAGHDKFEALIRQSAMRIDPRTLLTDYFRLLNDAGLARIDDAGTLAIGVLRLNASIVRDMALHNDPEAGAAERWAEVFPVIERAVFAR